MPSWTTGWRAIALASAQLTASESVLSHLHRQCLSSNHACPPHTVPGYHSSARGGFTLVGLQGWYLSHAIVTLASARIARAVAKPRMIITICTETQYAHGSTTLLITSTYWCC